MSGPGAYGAGGGTFASLRNRNYRRFWFGQLVSNTGNWLTNLALTLLVLQLTESGTAVGVLVACQYGPFLILSAWAGGLADRSNKRRLLIVTQSLELAQSAALAVLAFLPHPPLAGLFAVALTGGVFLAVDNPVRRAFVSELVPSPDLPNAVVLYSALVTTSQVIGPSLAGVLVSTIGFGGCFVVDAASYAVVLIALGMIRERELRRGPPVRREKGLVRAGVVYVLGHHQLRAIFAVVAITGMLTYRWDVSLTLLVKQGFQASDGRFTLFYATFSLGALLSALLTARMGRPTVRRVVVSAGATGAAMGLLAAAPGLGWAFAAVFVVGVVMIVCVTSVTAAVQVMAEQEFHGRVLALQSVLLLGTAPLGGPLLGYLGDVAGFRTPVAVGAGAAVLAGLAGWYIVRRGGHGAPRVRGQRRGPAAVPAEVAR
jgi:MFS family permease